MIKAKPAKLKSGERGARVTGTVRSSDVVTITTVGGESWTARVTKVVGSGDGLMLCATMLSSSRDRDQDYCYYPCPVSGRRCDPDNGPCHDCR